MVEYENGHYYSLNEYLQMRFGTKVYKLALDGGFTCPNRDGRIDTRGCIFCSGGGSGEFAQRRCDSIYNQIELAKKRVSSKMKKGKYIAYFQAFTNTYASVSYLETIFTQAILNDDIVALSIATRPDCLPDEVISLLSKLNKIKPVWIELGLQTIHNSTAAYIRRGYDLPVFENAIEMLKKVGIEVIVHIILGLPGESKEQMLQTVDYVGHSGAKGIKLQLLHILKGTDLANDFANRVFKTLEMDEYIDLLCDCLEILPSDMVIHRITGDGDKRLLIAPMWSANKKVVLNSINKVLNDRNIIQSSKYTK